MLTYTSRTTVLRTEKIAAPKRWGMFTSQGNRRLQKLAEALIKAVEKDPSRPAVRKALVTFVYKWERMSDYKSYREAIDTAVRECVGSFHGKICEITGLSSYDVWEESKKEAYKKYCKFHAQRKSVA